MTLTREMTCIVCPVGCRMTVTLVDGAVTGVTGNTCKRGPAYAIDECTAPKRMLTTTIPAEVNGRRVLAPVKTKAPIPKELLLDAMRVINRAVITAPARRGDVAVADICGTGVDVVLTDDVAQ